MTGPITDQNLIDPQTEEKINAGIHDMEAGRELPVDQAFRIVDYVLNERENASA